MKPDANEMRLLISRETGRRRTEIWIGESSSQWRRTEKVKPWHADDPRIRLLQLASQAPNVVTPSVVGSTLIYDLDQPFPLAFGLRAVNPTDVVNAVASSLGGLHNHAGEFAAPTAAIARVHTACQQAAWVTDVTIEHVERAMGAFSAPASARLLHGDLGLASVLEAAIGFQIVAGDDLAWGPRELDVGWLLGDLLEHARLRSNGPNEASKTRALGRAFLRAYARMSLPALQPELVIDFVVCRLLHHVFDAEAIAPGSSDAILKLLPDAEGWIADIRDSQTGGMA